MTIEQNQKIIQIVEVGPRDGLQNEKRVWSLADRVRLINLLSNCGFQEIEVGSFVSPKWIPQMADTDLVYHQIHRFPNTRYSILVPNEKGMLQALGIGIQYISIFTATTEAFTQHNINCSLEESFERFKPVMDIALKQNMRVRGYVSCAIECPYEGPVEPAVVAKVAARLYKMGCAEISLGDTIGKGIPETIRSMVRAVAQEIPLDALAIHCHDTYGQALDNILAALDEGIRIVDSSVHGLGGCPYARGKAKGNVATEVVVSGLPQHGYQTTIDYDALMKAKDFVQQKEK